MRKIFFIAAAAIVFSAAWIGIHAFGKRDSSLKQVMAPLRTHTSGRWNVDRHRTGSQDPERLAEALTLPYLQGYKAAPVLKNVTVYKKEAAAEGLNFCVSGHEPGAYLMDMRG